MISPMLALITTATILAQATVAKSNVAVPVGDEPMTLEAEKLEKPYTTDKFYSYTKSKNFSRWVYSPWSEPTFEDDKVWLKADPEGKKRSILISEISMLSDHLKKSKEYELTLNNSYSCETTKEPEALDVNDEKTCRVRLLVRCYGKTKDSEWGVTFEKSKDHIVSKAGTVKLSKAVIPGKDCQDGIHISAEASLLPGSTKTYAFKALKVGLTETAAN